MLRVLDLFSGIGGFSLGLERTDGFKTVAFCEIDPYCRKVLARHWPGVPIYGDIRELTAERLAADGIAADVICGGFPCQDISLAGKGAGMAGERSGLWSEYSRLIGELRPRYAIVENVAALLARGLDKVLGDLAALGYDAEWHCIPASAVGAPHRRDRLWIVADSKRGHARSIDRNVDGIAKSSRDQRAAQATPFDNCGQDVANAESCRCGEGRQGRPFDGGPWQSESKQPLHHMADTMCFGSPMAATIIELARERSGFDGGRSSWWFSEPDVGRVAHGVPNGVDRLRALGNAVVPQIPELIGRAILEVAA